MISDRSLTTDNGAPSALTLSDIEYPGGFYHDLSPAYLTFVCALNNQGGPDPSGDFSYCEIGCGSGETLVLIAACYPQAEFVGIDLNPKHVEIARALAQASALGNVEFICADIATIHEHELPKFDYITSHGLYSWVPTNVRAAIRHFMASKLKTGGITYFTYNAMPGWGSVAPLRQYFVERAQQLDGDILERVSQIIAELQTLHDDQAPFFSENPVAANILLKLGSADVRYVAHEYLTPTWHPQYFTDIYDDMLNAGLHFVAETSVLETSIAQTIPPAFARQIREESDVRQREGLRDFIQNRFFRRDVFIKPEATQTSSTRKNKLDDTLFGLISHPAHIPNSIQIANAPALQLDGPTFDQIKERLAYRVLTVNELLRDPLLGPLGRKKIIDCLTRLAVGGFCTPCLRRETAPSREPSERIRLVPKVNEVLLQRHNWDVLPLTLASPVLGSGITLSGLEIAFLDGLQRGESLQWIWGQCQKRGVTIRSEGTATAISDADEALDALAAASAQFLRYKLPKLAYLGIVQAID